MILCSSSFIEVIYGFISSSEESNCTNYTYADDVDRDTDDELEMENFTLSSSANPGSGEASSSSGPSQTKVSDHFVSMGFSHNMVAKAIQEHGS
ncbi:hypothetical protein ABKV19_026636 [Rosa sericea]